MQNITGRRIREIRKSKHPRITQADLAASLQLKGFKIDRAGVAKIESGYRQVSDIELAALADALKVSAAYLLGETDEPSIEHRKTRRGR